MAELYASRLLRLMAVNMVSGIASIYLYQLGYPVWFILGFFSIYFVCKAAMAFPAAYVIARVGPKHANLISNILYIQGLVVLTQIGHGGVPVLLLFGLLQAAAVSLYIIAYHVNFSKVKHLDHAGKELGFMYSVEKIGAGLSPVVGGVIAYIVSPEATMWAACGVFLLSSLPLFFSPEPTITRQHIMFRGYNWRRTWRNLVSSAGLGIDQVASLGMWVLFVAIVVLGTTDDVVYAQIGGLTTIAFVSSLVFAGLYGRLIDHRRGGELLGTAVSINAVVYALRPFITSTTGVIGINIANEAVTSGYTMPYLKGQFDMADSLPGYRIVYMAMMDWALSIGAAVFSLIAAVLAYTLGEVLGMQVAYVVAAVMALLIAGHGFPALRMAR